MKQMIWMLAACCGLMAADAPPAEAVLDRYVEATGGKAAYSALKSQVARGRIEFSGQGITGAITTTAAAGKSLIVIDLGQMGAIKTGSADGVAWQNSAMQGPRLLDGDEKTQALRAAMLDAPLRWRELFTGVRAAGQDAVNGKTCLLVEMTPKGAARPETNCYDQESGLLVRSRSTLSSPMGDIAVETTLSDYRKVDGMLVAHRMEQKVGPQGLITVLEEVRLNGSIDPATLTPPAEVQALIAKAK